MKSHLELVKEFHKCFGAPVSKGVHLSDRDLNNLRIKLLYEEYTELVREFNRPDGKTPDPQKVTKELSDLLYVLLGAAIAWGLPLDQAFRQVHMSNMSKLGPDGEPVRRGDGKILKGPNYFEPNLERLFDENVD